MHVLHINWLFINLDAIFHACYSYKSLLHVLKINFSTSCFWAVYTSSHIMFVIFFHIDWVCIFILHWWVVLHKAAQDSRGKMKHGNNKTDIWIHRKLLKLHIGCTAHNRMMNSTWIEDKCDIFIPSKVQYTSIPIITVISVIYTVIESELDAAYWYGHGNWNGCTSWSFHD